jgi:predicted nucleic acid-binding Zn ribbon protein
MERAGRVVRRSGVAALVSPEQLAIAAWPAAVGKIVAGHTRPAALVRGCLIVETEDALWRKQLFPLTSQILGKMEHVIGPGIVRDLEFRPAGSAPRKAPQRETMAAGGVLPPYARRKALP